MQTTQLETSRVTGAVSAVPENGAASPEPAAPLAPSLPLVEPLTPEQIVELKNAIVAQLYTVFDPEVPVNIYELGLVYEIEIAPTGAVLIRMTLTSPMCPVAGSLPGEVERKVRAVPNVTSAKIDLVFDPPWTKDRMSEAAKLQLGIDD